MYNIYYTVGIYPKRNKKTFGDDNVKKTLIIILTLCALAAAQNRRSLAVLPSVADRNALDQQRLVLLTDKVREIAAKTLPIDGFLLLKQDAIVKRVGEEELFRACKEGVCVGELTRNVGSDYGARCDIVKLDNSLVLKFELYSVNEDAILETFTQYDLKDFREMLTLLDARLPDAFRKMFSAPKIPQSGIGSVEYGGSNYTVDLNTTPQGAGLRFNGISVSSCAKSPCRTELPEGNVRISATLAQYETADTTITISQNNQLINIKLKPNFGLLRIKPAYSENIGVNKGWSLTIDGNAYTSYENALSPGNYTVKLSHECYEDMSFKATIAKAKRETFDMTQHLKLKTGSLVLNAEKIYGGPVIEPVFVNGKQVGETPFNGPVPVCAEITIGNDRNKVDVTLAHNQVAQYKYIIPDGPPAKTPAADKILTDGRNSVKEQRDMERAREQQRQEAEKTLKGERKKKTAIGTAIGFDIIGAGIILYGGLIENNNAEKSVNDFDRAGADGSITARNAAYIIGGALLAAGISIHIIF